LGAKKRALAAPSHTNVGSVARTSILDQISLVPQTDHTGALSDFAFGSPGHNLKMARRGLWS
jgi:hypothetical protein